MLDNMRQQPDHHTKEVQCNEFYANGVMIFSRHDKRINYLGHETP